MDGKIPIEVTLARGGMSESEIRRYRQEAAAVLRELAGEVEADRT